MIIFNKKFGINAAFVLCLFVSLATGVAVILTLSATRLTLALTFASVATAVLAFLIYSNTDWRHYGIVMGFLDDYELVGLLVLLLVFYMVGAKIQRFVREQPTVVVITQNQVMYDQTLGVLHSYGYDPDFTHDTTLAKRSMFFGGNLIVNLPGEQSLKDLNDPSVAIVIPNDDPVKEIRNLWDRLDSQGMMVRAHPHPDEGTDMDGKITLLNGKDGKMGKLVWGFRKPKKDLPGPTLFQVLKMFWQS